MPQRSRRVTVTAPEGLVADIEESVRLGEVASVSAYFTKAAAGRLWGRTRNLWPSRDEAREQSLQLCRQFPGGDPTPEHYAWAASALGQLDGSGDAAERTS